MSTSLPNPTTPLAFLPPEIATQYEISRYVYVASLGAFIWDLLIHISTDYVLIFKRSFSITSVVYIFSRALTLAYIITSTVFQIGEVQDCQALQVALGICLCLSTSSTSLLFFFRVRAVFDRKKYVVLFFFVLWLGVLGGTVTIPFAIQGGHIGPTKYCINTAVKSFSSVGIVISGVNDTLVFLAISWRLITTTSMDDSTKARISSFLGRTRLPNLTQAVLKSGQQYYAFTVGLNIVSVVMILTPGVPPVYKAFLTIPNAGLMNSMACLVYRNIRLGSLSEIPNTAGPQSSGSSSAALPVAIGHRRAQPGQQFPTSRIGGVQVSKVTHEIHDDIPMQVRYPYEQKGDGAL